MKDDNIIEVEVVSETISTPTKGEEKPKKTAWDHSKAISFWGKVQSYCLRFSWAAILTGIGIWAFSILFMESHSPFYLTMLIICASLTGILLIGLVVGIIARAIMRKYKKDDPNFEQHVEDDEVF